MKKLMVTLVILAFAFPVWVPGLSAQAAEGEAVMEQEVVVEVGNKVCPVTGNPVSGKDFVEYKGKRYGICCPACKDKFLADADAMVAKVEELGKEVAAKAEAAVESAATAVSAVAQKPAAPAKPALPAAAKKSEETVKKTV